MFKKANRLAKAKDISITFARGRAFFNQFYTIKYLANPKELKFSVVVSTKVFKRSNQRNRLKRVLREYIRQNLSKFKTGSYLILVKPKAAKLDEVVRRQSFLDLIGKLK